MLPEPDQLLHALRRHQTNELTIFDHRLGVAFRKTGQDVIHRHLGVQTLRLHPNGGIGWCPVAQALDRGREVCGADDAQQAPVGCDRNLALPGVHRKLINGGQRLVGFHFVEQVDKGIPHGQPFQVGFERLGLSLGPGAPPDEE